MEKQKKWQCILIAIVVVLTVYNILPTVLFYSKPLSEPITESRATTIVQGALARINALEDESLSWLKSYNKLLETTPSSMTLDPENRELIHIRYGNEKDARRMKRYLPRAGSLIPFVPAQLSLVPVENGDESTLVTVQRKIPIQFDESKINDYFSFTEKRDGEGKISPLYHRIVDDRLVRLGLAIGGTGENARYLETVIHDEENPRISEFLQTLAQNVLTYTEIFGENSPIAKRYYSTVTQGLIDDKRPAVERLIKKLEYHKDQIKLERIALQDAESARREKGGFLEGNERQQLDYFKTREERLNKAIGIIGRQKVAFSNGADPWTEARLKQDLELAGKNNDPLETLPVRDRNPLVKAIDIDWNNERISLELHEDILDYKLKIARSKPYLNDQIDRLIYNEIARIARETAENPVPYQNSFAIELNRLTDSQSLLVMDLGAVAKIQAEKLFHLIKILWNPSHPDLKRSSFPIYDYQTYSKLPPHQQKMGLVIYAPTGFETEPLLGFRHNSIYVVAKGLQEILAKFEENPNAPQAKVFIRDFSKLRDLLQNRGFNGYPGSTYPLSGNFAKDFIFEAEDFYRNIIAATREDFTVYGTRKFATLEFTDVEQRLLALNRIETQMHEDLLKWRDEYQAAQLKEELHGKYDIPAPTKNPLWSNLALSARKYFRGDERKTLRWGLDLSGGKTVRIQIRDPDNKVVTNDADIKQGIDELYTRVNKMGVSEVSIRQEGSNITLDFPSAQGLSATDLIKASSMYFHIVNEKFSTSNTELAPAVHRFLQDIWNEAVVTNRKDIDSINRIARKHLYGDTLDNEIGQPVSQAAKTLYDHGLRLANPNDTAANSTFNDSVSKLAIFRGDHYTDWQGQTHPLLVVMKNYTLEGANLTDVHTSYDPTRGNFLAFNVKGSQTFSDGQKVNPRNDLYHWTAPFSKEKIQGTPLDKFSGGEGWRMAVILNGLIVNTATVSSPLKDSVSISGSFTQREANRLEADLKAGSLSFTPHILSETNVSPELGLKDRTMGILATIIALVSVIVIMVGYYRFAGVIASIAVVINLLIIWATLVNISATVTLAGIAGIILTVGMAVDANVLVFERIREEFAISGRIAPTIHAGYRKAFSAIIDSNITTIIAALILLQFNSGPIKGFAVTLIIGIVSSMFTALFMTRYFFAVWVRNPKNKELKMVDLIKKTRFNFLKYGKISLYSSLAIILIGGYLLVSEKNSILGTDFTGGYSATFEIKAKSDEDYKKKVEQALIAAGATAQDIQVRGLSPSNNVKILLGTSLDRMGRPFEKMPIETDNKDLLFRYQNNPRLVWVVNALASGGLELTPQSLKRLDIDWTSISGQMSNAMRNNALIGLAVALLCILIYITLRFEFKYAVSATLGLAIDVGMTFALMSILHTIGIPIQIDLNTIAAIMTIIGYSLNDTIIIFDRIREDLKQMRKRSFKDVVNHALNVTLNRTVMTSGTTLVVLLALLFLGGNAIFGLSLVMVIGVIFGTFSSLYVAAPLLLFFHKKEKGKTEKGTPHEN
ncbi:MAG: protein translocase subunit SecD [Chlamydiota bacterium]